MVISEISFLDAPTILSFMLQKTLEKLISFKTVTGNYTENELALSWIKNEIKDLHVSIKEFKYNEFLSLVISTQDTKKPILWLAGHIDVVDGSKRMFNPVIKDNKLYGRGAYDMKFAIACYIELLKEMKNELADYNFAVMITTDEEVGGRNGTAKILDAGYEGDVCILPDGGFNWAFRQRGKRGMKLKVVSSGKSVHSSRPWNGENSIDYLMDFVRELKKEFPYVTQNNSDHYYTTCEITIINGGQSLNQIPDYAEAVLDIRFIPDTSLEELRKIILKVKSKYLNIEIEEIGLGETFSLNSDNKYFKSFSKIAEDSFGIKPTFCMSHGSSDAHFFYEKGIFPIVIAPKGHGNHSEEEWIDVKDLQRFYNVLMEFVKLQAKLDG